MKKILILGSGSHAKVIFSEILNLKKYKLIGFIDDFEKKNKIIISYKKKNFKILGKINDLKKIKFDCAVIGIGDNSKREKIKNKTEKIKKNIKWEKIISKNAKISINVKIGDGSVIISGTNINIGTKIGSHCLINSSSSIDHDNFFGDFSSTGPGVVTGGNVSIGKYSHLGIGSTIKNNITVDMAGPTAKRRKIEGGADGGNPSPAVGLCGFQHPRDDPLITLFTQAYPWPRTRCARGPCRYSARGPPPGPGSPGVRPRRAWPRRPAPSPFRDQRWPSTRAAPPGLDRKENRPT